MYCNYNDNGIGFPRDCGKNGGVGGQWNSKTRGGHKVTWKVKKQGGAISTRGVYESTKLIFVFGGVVSFFDYAITGHKCCPQIALVHAHV